MEITYSLGIWGGLVLVLGALVIGVALQFIGEVRTGFEWAIAGIGAFVGGLVASEWIVAWQAFGPVYDGIALVPAVAGGLVLGIAVDAIVRYSTEGSYTHRVTV